MERKGDGLHASPDGSQPGRCTDVAIVFVLANLTWYLNGKEQHIRARPTLVAEKSPTGEWKIAVFQNTLITDDAAPTLADTLAGSHPYKGNTPLK